MMCFSMYNYKIEKIIKVIDGDTVDVLIDLGFKTFIKKRIRVYGINTPETRTRNPEEKAKGLKAKARVCELLTQEGLEIFLESHGVGKFGRVIGSISFGLPSNEKKDLSDLLVLEGHAEEYYGGKR